MSFLADEIEKRLAETERLIGEIETHAVSQPSGRLRVSIDGRRTRYYHVKTAGEKECYLRRSERRTAEALAQKEYDQQVLKSLCEERKRLAALRDFYRAAGSGHDGEGDFFSGPEELIWSSLHPARQALVTPAVPDDTSFVKEWMSEEYEKKGFDENAVDFLASGDIRVRSKTEWMIAEMLKKENIPFYYEKPLKLRGAGIIHPDFTVLNVRTRQTFYWEHMGLLDDPDYRERALERIVQYEMNGYYPGKSLLLTHETSARPVRPRILEKIIETYLI